MNTNNIHGTIYNNKIINLKYIRFNVKICNMN